MPLSIIISGALGRMGRELAIAAGAEGVAIAGGADVAYSGQSAGFPIFSELACIASPADALIDFSRPEALHDVLKYIRPRGMPAVLCATGYTDCELEAVSRAAEDVAILRSANMSLGVNVMRRLVAMASKALGDGFDIEIVEKHHRMKLDSPSGTAILLRDAAVRGGAETVYGRYGRQLKRAPREIGVHAVRGGTMTGEHEVGFYGSGEELLITHRAENRVVFARGALSAARFLADKPPGLYDMDDVVREIIGV